MDAPQNKSALIIEFCHVLEDEVCVGGDTPVDANPAWLHLLLPRSNRVGPPPSLQLQLQNNDMGLVWPVELSNVNCRMWLLSLRQQPRPGAMPGDSDGTERQHRPGVTHSHNYLARATGSDTSMENPGSRYASSVCQIRSAYVLYFRNY